MSQIVWKAPSQDQRRYSCHVAVFKDEPGWSAIVLNLPGCGSCGDTREEAIANVREAIKGCTESYLEDGDTIPWCTEYGDDEIPRNSELMWLLVECE